VFIHHPGLSYKNRPKQNNTSSRYLTAKDSFPSDWDDILTNNSPVKVKSKLLNYSHWNWRRKSILIFYYNLNILDLAFKYLGEGWEELKYFLDSKSHFWLLSNGLALFFVVFIYFFVFFCLLFGIWDLSLWGHILINNFISVIVVPLRLKWKPLIKK
jgi:hypothetical protein